MSKKQLTVALLLALLLALFAVGMASAQQPFDYMEGFSQHNFPYGGYVNSGIESNLPPPRNWENFGYRYQGSSFGFNGGVPYYTRYYGYYPDWAGGQNKGGGWEYYSYPGMLPGW